MNLHDLGDLMALELQGSEIVGRSGKVTEVVGTLVRASGLSAKLGEMCHLLAGDGSVLQVAEVIGSADLVMSRIERVAL